MHPARKLPEFGSDYTESVDDNRYLPSQLLLVGWHTRLEGTKLEAE